MRFFIELDNPSRSYFAGQTITGRVIFTNNIRPVDHVKEISLTFEGNANVRWKKIFFEAPGDSQAKPILYLVSKEKYFSQTITLFENDRMFTLSSETITPFQFTLPLNLPSSFTNPLGKVHYCMEARLKTAWPQDARSSIAYFSVIGILDLNLQQGLAEPVCHEKQKNIGCLCCKSGPVGYKLTLQRTGFVPGEYAQFNAEFTNHSRRKIKGINLTLVQVCTFYAQGETRTVTKDIVTAVGPSIEPGDSDYWGGNILRIPALPPSKLSFCKIIDVQYVLTFVVSGTGVKMKTEVPIIIGTIPFRHTFTDFLPSTIATSDDPPPSISFSSTAVAGHSQCPGPVPTAPVFDMYPDLPPPTYSEAMQIDKFEYNMKASGDNRQTNLGFEDEQEVQNTEQGSSTSEPYPPTEYDYVPNYITYKTHK